MTTLITILLIILSGVFSGLTLGLMTLSSSDLKRKSELGDKHATKIYPIRKNGNLLLCTLLVGNVLVNSILSIYLSGLYTGLIAVVFSTFFITIFGEILPQAYCSKHPLKVAANLLFLVQIFTFVLYPITYPLSKMLDCLLGGELKSYFSKKELSFIIEEHEQNNDSNIDVDEKEIMLGALQFSDKTVKEVMTPKKVVYMIEKNTEITDEILKDIKDRGHSRIPIYDRFKDNIISILLVKDLILNKETIVCNAAKRSFNTVLLDSKLDIVFNDFISTGNHLFIVVDSYDTVVGVITMEDILEEIIKKEIVDETDNYTDMREQA